MRACFVLFCFFFVSCSSTEKLNTTINVRAKPHEIWRILEDMFSGYKLQIKNTRKGILKLAPLKGSACFAPSPNVVQSSGVICQILVTVKYKKPFARISVIKYMTLKKSYLSKREPVSSDKLQEHLILYRLKRELRISKLVKKYVN